MWKTNGAEMTDREISLLLNSTSSGVIILDGPSGCGKTTIISTIKNSSKLISSAELVNQCLELQATEGTDFISIISKKLAGYDVVCFEDLDMMLSGKPATTDVIERIIKEKSGESLIVVTGIDIDRRVPGFAEAVGAEQYEYYD